MLRFILLCSTICAVGLVQGLSQSPNAYPSTGVSAEPSPIASPSPYEVPSESPSPAASYPAPSESPSPSGVPSQSGYPAPSESASAVSSPSESSSVSPASYPTGSATSSESSSVSLSVSLSVSPVYLPSESATLSVSVSPATYPSVPADSASPTLTETPSVSPNPVYPTPTETASASPSAAVVYPTPTETASPSTSAPVVYPTPTDSASASPSAPAVYPTLTETASASPSAAIVYPTVTETATPSASAAVVYPTLTETASASPSAALVYPSVSLPVYPSVSELPSNVYPVSPSHIPSPSCSAYPSFSPLPRASSSPSYSASASLTSGASASNTASVSLSGSGTCSDSASASYSPSASMPPSITPSPTACPPDTALFVNSGTWPSSYKVVCIMFCPYPVVVTGPSLTIEINAAIIVDAIITVKELVLERGGKLHSRHHPVICQSATLEGHIEIDVDIDIAASYAPSIHVNDGTIVNKADIKINFDVDVAFGVGSKISIVKFGSLSGNLFGGVTIIKPPALPKFESFNGKLSGALAVPPNQSTGKGSFAIDIDVAKHQLRVSVEFSALKAAVTMAHIHCCTPTALTGSAGVAVAFSAFPLAIRGKYNVTLDLTKLATYSQAFITAHGGTAAACEAALLAGLRTGLAYVNIHTNLFPDGEITDFIRKLIPTNTGVIDCDDEECCVVGVPQISASPTPSVSFKPSPSAAPCSGDLTALLEGKAFQSGACIFVVNVQITINVQLFVVPQYSVLQVDDNVDGKDVMVQDDAVLVLNKGKLNAKSLRLLGLLEINADGPQVIVDGQVQITGSVNLIVPANFTFKAGTRVVIMKFLKGARIGTFKDCKVLKKDKYSARDVDDSDATSAIVDCTDEECAVVGTSATGPTASPRVVIDAASPVESGDGADAMMNDRSRKLGLGIGLGLGVPLVVALIALAVLGAKRARASRAADYDEERPGATAAGTTAVTSADQTNTHDLSWTHSKLDESKTGTRMHRKNAV